MQYFTIPALFAIVLELSTGVQANFEKHKAVQVNFYKDNSCSNYNGEMAFWHSNNEGKTPATGYWSTTSGPLGGDCFDFREGSETATLNIAGCWAGDGKKWDGGCKCVMYDNWSCKGNKAELSKNCLTSRSVDGWQWKSAKCYVNTN